MRSPDSVVDSEPRCEEVALELPAILDRRLDASSATVSHVESCLRCQAELSQYRRMLRLLAQLRDEEVPLPAGALAEILANVRRLARRQAIRSALFHRRVAYATGLVALGSVAVVIGVAKARPTRLRQA